MLTLCWHYLLTRQGKSSYFSHYVALIKIIITITKIPQVFFLYVRNSLHSCNLVVLFLIFYSSLFYASKHVQIALFTVSFFSFTSQYNLACMWGNVGLFCNFSPKLPRTHVGLHCNANRKTNREKGYCRRSVEWMAVFTLEDALSVWTNLGQHL